MKRALPFGLLLAMLAVVTAFVMMPPDKQYVALSTVSDAVDAIKPDAASDQSTATSPAGDTANIYPASPTVAAHIVNLPEDGQAWHFTVVTSSAWKTSARERQLIAWVDLNPTLASLKVQTHFHHYTADDRLFNSRLKASVGSGPAVILQQGDGKVVYKASGQNLPASDAILVSQIQKAISDCCPWLHPFRPRPNPSPSPTPGPDVTPAPTPSPDDKPLIPDVGPIPPDDTLPPDAPKQDATFLVMAIACAIAGAATIFVQFKRRVYGAI